MNTSIVQSRDGTTIAYERSGDGPALILVDGALCYRGSGPSRKLAALLAERFTVFTYDRRGRGESGDTAPYAVEREVEDLQALIEAAGGSAHACGFSSGAVLALEAARNGAAIDKLAMYEAPFIIDDSRPVMHDYVPRLEELVGANRRGAALKLFMRHVGMPAALVAMMPLMPAWRKLKAIAPTLEYDAAVMGDTQLGKPLPAGRWDGVPTSTLVLVGGKSPTWMQHGMHALTETLPYARRRVLDGQTHMVKPKVLAPVLAEYFGQPADVGSRSR